VPQIKRTKITDDFVDVIRYLLDTEKIDYERLKMMSDNENNLFKNLIMKSGLYDTLKYNYSETRANIKDIIEQYEILKGQIEADNDNPEIIEKSKKVLKQLKNYGKISEKDYYEIVEEL
jgi:hypothetical protein